MAALTPEGHHCAPSLPQIQGDPQAGHRKPPESPCSCLPASQAESRTGSAFWGLAHSSGFKALFGKGMGSKGPLVNSTATSLEFLGGPLPLRPLEGGECCRVLRLPLQLGKLLWAKGQWEPCRGVHPAPTWAGATQVPPPSTPGPEPSKTPLFSHLPLSLDVPSTVQASFSENFHSLATHATTVSGLGRCRASWLASLLPL